MTKDESFDQHMDEQNQNTQWTFKVLDYGSLKPRLISILCLACNPCAQFDARRQMCYIDSCAQMTMAHRMSETCKMSTKITSNAICSHFLFKVNVMTVFRDQTTHVVCKFFRQLVSVTCFYLYISMWNGFVVYFLMGFSTCSTFESSILCFHSKKNQRCLEQIQ